jgi:hypothetical protein
MESIEFNFIPQVGMKTNDCYLHGIGNNENIHNHGEIVYVGKYYFVLEDKVLEDAILVNEESY